MAYPMVRQVGKVGIVICIATSQWRTAMTCFAKKPNGLLLRDE